MSIDSQVSLGIPAVSIPIAVIVGLAAGSVVGMSFNALSFTRRLTITGYLIYKTGTTSTLHWFLVGSTSILFLIGAGLFSKAIGFFEYYTFAKGVGGDVAETGDGPGSFRVAGNVWHLTYGMSLAYIGFELTDQEIPRLAVLPPTVVGKFSTLFLAGVSHAQYVQLDRVLIIR